jgi:hypothetical protein
MAFFASCLLTTGALTTTKVPVAPVSATSMLLVGGGVCDGEEPARSADAILMKLLVSIILRFCRRPSLSFERFATSSIVASEHKLVVELLAYIARDHRVSTEHAFDCGSGFVAISFVGAGIAVVGGVTTQGVRPTVAPVGSDWAILGMDALGGLVQKCLGGGEGCGSCGQGSIFGMDAGA